MNLYVHFENELSYKLNMLTFMCFVYLYINSFLIFSEGSHSLYPLQTVFVGGYTVFTLSERPSDRVSVTFCFLNNFKNL